MAPKQVVAVCLQNLCLNVQKICAGEEKLPVLEPMVSFRSLSESNVICAIIHEQVQHFYEMP